MFESEGTLENEVPQLQKDIVSPNERERIAFILNATKKDLEGEHVVGYHGTSIESLQYMLAHGTFPGRTKDSSRSDKLPQTGDLYFAPIREKFPTFKLAEAYHPRQRFYELGIDKDPPQGNPIILEAEGYAGDVARKHYILSQLGLPLHNERYEDLVSEIESRTQYEKQINNMYPWRNKKYMNKIIREHGFTTDQLSQVGIDAWERKGIVFGISDLVVANFQILDGEGDDLRIRAPKGIPYQYFPVVKPLGEPEMKFFNHLQRRIKAA